MRLEYVFVLIVVRVAMSFVPECISLHRKASHNRDRKSISRQILWALGNDIHNHCSLQSLESFVSIIETLNRQHRTPQDNGDPFRIVSRGDDLSEYEHTQTRIFYDSDRMDVFLAICQETLEMDHYKICDECSNDHIVAVPTDMVESLCGFPAETLPCLPLGQHLAPTVSSCTILLDEKLVKDCTENNLCIIGGAGYPYWKLLLTKKAIDLLQEMDNVRVADLVLNDDPEEDENLEITEPTSDQVWEVSSTETGFKNPPTIDRSRSRTERNTPAKTPEESHQKPYFAFDGPSINIARLMVRQKEISNPLTPLFLTAVGRIGNISATTKRSLRCEFLPPSTNHHKRNNEGNDQTGPWRSISRNGSISVCLVFGKVFLQSIGTKQGQDLIGTIQEGQLVQIEAQTNPGRRESLEQWVNTNCLELTVMDCLFLSPGLGTGVDDPNSSRDSHSGKKKKMETQSSLPTLSLENVFDNSFAMEFVDDLDSVAKFSKDLSKFISRIEDDNDDKNPASASPFVGIDCEWRPREFMENPNLPQPALLFQISFHELRRVYLLDLQTLLRPLESPNTFMNTMEREVSNALSLLLNSERIIKVGYQLSSDLRRIFASYPHMSCFQEVRSTIEISSFIKRVLRISKQKKSRNITMSLAAMTSHYLGMTLDKELQLTDWSVRELATKQLEYAALDAAVTPKLMEKVLESIGASVQQQQQNGMGDTALLKGPSIRRWNRDDAFVKEIVSWRFVLLPENTDESTIGELRAKQIVGSSWIASTVWTVVENPPPPYDLPSSIY